MLWGKKTFKSTTIHPLARRPPCPSPRGAWAERLRLCVTGKATVFLAISGPLLQDSVHCGGKEEPLTNASQGRKQQENRQMLPTGRCGAMFDLPRWILTPPPAPQMADLQPLSQGGFWPLDHLNSVWPQALSLTPQGFLALELDYFHPISAFLLQALP